MSTHQDAKKQKLPDPKEIAKTYFEVASRASKLLTDHIHRQVSKGINVPSDELEIAQAFMDMMAKMLANPYKLARAQMNLFWDYYSLWQHSTMRFLGLSPEPVAAPHKDDKRFQDELWEEHFLFDFIKQSYLITARHIHDVVQNVENMEERTAQKVNFSTASSSTPCHQQTLRTTGGFVAPIGVLCISLHKLHPRSRSKKGR